MRQSFLWAYCLAIIDPVLMQKLHAHKDVCIIQNGAARLQMDGSSSSRSANYCSSHVAIQCWGGGNDAWGIRWSHRHASKTHCSAGKQKLLSGCVSHSQVTNAGFRLMFWQVAVVNPAVRLFHLDISGTLQDFKKKVHLHFLCASCWHTTFPWGRSSAWGGKTKKEDK